MSTNQRTQFACSWCHHEINADHTQGAAISDADWGKWTDHGICATCTAEQREKIHYSKQARTRAIETSAPVTPGYVTCAKCKLPTPDDYCVSRQIGGVMGHVCEECFENEQAEATPDCSHCAQFGHRGGRPRVVRMIKRRVTLPVRDVWSCPVCTRWEEIG